MCLESQGAVHSSTSVALLCSQLYSAVLSSCSRLSTGCHLEAGLSNSQSLWQENPGVAEAEHCWCPALALHELLCAQSKSFQILRLRKWELSLQGQNSPLHAVSFPFSLAQSSMCSSPSGSERFLDRMDNETMPRAAAPAACGGSTQACSGQLTQVMELQPPYVSFSSA